MLQCLIISPDTELAGRFEKAVSPLRELEIRRILPGYPSEAELQRTVRFYGPQVVFLSFESSSKAVKIAKFIENQKTGTQIVAIHRSLDPQALRESMRAGVREFLAAPFERRTLVDSLDSVKRRLSHQTVEGATREIFTFLPAKGGVGASTLALNVSAALARRPDTRVLLSDFDISLGTVGFQLQIKDRFSVVDAVQQVGTIDEDRWLRSVARFEGLDVLHSGRLNPNIYIDPEQIRNLVEFLTSNYDALCFDLSSNLEQYSVELMRASKRIFLVATPELASLHLARQKLDYLESVDLRHRVSVVLNRASKNALLTPAQVEEVLGEPVTYSFSNDYLGLGRALATSKWLSPDSDLGKQFIQFSQGLLVDPARKVPAEPPKRSLLEYLTGKKRLAFVDQA
jgi:pilus assembly protein CpaE